MEPFLLKYIVRPVSFPVDLVSLDNPFKIVDFGESFSGDAIPRTLNTPIAVRAPEIIFGDRLDHRVDMWAMGCLVRMNSKIGGGVYPDWKKAFRAHVGHPPFDTILQTPTSLVREMLEMIDDELPRRWQEAWRVMDLASSAELSGYTLQAWLEESFFAYKECVDLSREDVGRLGKVINIMLRFDPASRAPAEEFLQDPWFDDA